MPYIKQDRKDSLSFQKYSPQNSGELNFILSQTCINYLDSHGINYIVMNDIVGALECAKQEFIRRVVNPYEEKKIEENGDIYRDIEELLVD